MPPDILGLYLKRPVFSIDSRQPFYSTKPPVCANYTLILRTTWDYLYPIPGFFMANKAHLYRIKKGATAWNDWRRKARGERPELSNAALGFCKLAGGDLADANLWEANLKKSDLKGADLKGAELSFADLSGADLSGADLSGANLTEVNLCGANLRGAILKSVNGWSGRLKGADLTDADLTGAEAIQAPHLAEAL